MLTNSFIVHETPNQQNMNPQHAEEAYFFSENFHTQEFSNTNNLEVNDYGKQHHPIQWTADEIVKNTNLRIEAAEFVPRCVVTDNTKINFETTNADQSAVYSSSDGHNAVPSSEETNKLSWADEIVDECLPNLNSEYYSSAEVNESVPIIQQIENLDMLNTVPTRSFEEFVGTNVNFSEDAEQLESVEVDVSVDKTDSLEKLSNTNVSISVHIDRTDQCREKENISDRYNRNFQSRQQYDNNREYNKNWKRDDVRSDDNYRPKGKPRSSQSFRENGSRGRHEEQWDYRRTYYANNNKQENESSYRHQENDTRPNKRYSDRAKNQDGHRNYEHRKNYQRSSPNFIKNKNEGPDKQGSTNEVKLKEEIPHTNGSTSDITEKKEIPDQIGTTDTWESDHKDRPKETVIKEPESKSEVHNSDEDNCKRKWSDRQSFGNKEVDDSKPINEEKGAKPRIGSFQKGRFINSRSSSNNSGEFRDKKPDEKPQQQVEPAGEQNFEVDDSKPINEEKGAKPRIGSFQKGRFINSRSSSNNSGEFRDKKQDEKPQQQVEPAGEQNFTSTENTERGEPEHHKERKSKFFQNSEYKNRKPETNNHYKTNTEGFDEEKFKKEKVRRSLDSNNHYKTYTEGFDEEKFKKEKARRSLDTNKSLKGSKYKTKDQYTADRSHNDAEDKTRSYRRSFNKDETDKRPNKPLFTEKRNNEKPRDLKQERGGVKVEKTVHYEEYRNIAAESSYDHLYDKKYSELDPEYKAFLQELKDNKIDVSEKIKEQKQDLFKMPKDYSLAHCVAEDMRMGSGIAVTFRDTFGNVDSLLAARERPGGLAALKEGSRFLYYLVTKKRSRDKPFYKDFWCSMKRLRDHIKKYRIAKLAVPTLGCGLDNLNWPTVKHMIGFIFKDVPIEIVVCNFTPIEEVVPRNYIKIHRKSDKLKNAKESIIVYFTTADSHVSDEMVELNERFSFLEDFKKATKLFGGVVQSKVSDCILCGCVVRRTLRDPFNYKSLSIVLCTLKGIIAAEGCDTIALQCLKDEQDDLLHQKIVTVIVNYVKNADVNVYTGDADVSLGET